jgi:hypothetical protein
MNQQVLTRANRELFRRPADQCFKSMGDLYSHCQQMDQRSSERWILPAQIEAVHHLLGGRCPDAYLRQPQLHR